MAEDKALRALQKRMPEKTVAALCERKGATGYTWLQLVTEVFVGESKKDYRLRDKQWADLRRKYHRPREMPRK
eukprot:13600554-Alexandrium_andersonii.AAC.1